MGQRSFWEGEREGDFVPVVMSRVSPGIDVVVDGMQSVSEEALELSRFWIGRGLSF
jgi:hypothetical protein